MFAALIILWEQGSIPMETLQREEGELYIYVSPHNDLIAVLPVLLLKISASLHAKSVLNARFHS